MRPTLAGQLLSAELNCLEKLLSKFFFKSQAGKGEVHYGAANLQSKI